jgi:hypothetical protein
VADLDPRTVVLLGGFAIGLSFGALARWSAFCVRGAVEDALTTPDALRLRGYLLAAIVALTYTGASMDFGIAWVLGIPIGAAGVSLLRHQTSLEGFDGAGSTLRYLAGGALMGIGGVLSLGCTIGQGLTGVSTLSIGSLLAIALIFIGAALTMMWRQIAAARPVGERRAAGAVSRP